MKYTANFNVTCHDVDTNNNIKPTSLIRRMNEAGDYQMRDRKPSYKDMFMMGQAFIITRMNVKIYNKIRQYDSLKVDTWVCPGKVVTFPRCHQVFANGILAAEAYSEWAVVNRNNGKLCKKNEVPMENFDMDEELNIAIPKRFRYEKDIAWNKVGERQVYYSDCDMNMHMNNANYLNIIWNFIPNVERKQLTSINIRFMKEAALNDTMEIFVTKLDRAFAKDEDAEEVYGFMTKVNNKSNVECVMGVKTIE